MSGPSEQYDSAGAALSAGAAAAASSALPAAAAPGRSFGRLLGELLSNGAWALAEQGVVSLGNYVTLLIVAHNLADARQLGTFTVLLNILLFLCSLQQAVVIYPLLVRGAALDKAAMQRFAAGCLILTGIVCIPLAIAMLFTSVYFAGPSLVLWAPLALIFQQLQETTRRSLIAQLRFAAAIPGDALSYLGQAGILLMCGHGLTLPITFAALAGTSAIAMALQAMQIGPRRMALSQLKPMIADFWNLSRWVLFSNLGGLITNNSYELVLYLTWGAAPVGYWGAMAFSTKLVNPLTTSLSGVIIPSVSRASADRGKPFAIRLGVKYALLGLAALTVYFGVLGVFPRTCLSILFGAMHPDYVHNLPGPLRAMLCVWTLFFITNMALAILNGLGYSRANFSATLANAIITVLISLPLVYAFGLWGIILGGFVATGAAATVAIYCLIQHHNDVPTSAPTAPG